MKKSSLLFLFSFIFTTALWAGDCQMRSIKYIENSKTIQKKEMICLNNFKDTEEASSKNCRLLIDEKCPFRLIKKGPDYNSFIKPVGSPNYYLCQYLKGKPESYHVEIEGQWKSFERCVWKDNIDFVDFHQMVFFYQAL